MTLMLFTSMPISVLAEGCNHVWGNWSIQTAPTLTTTGTAERTCTKDSTHKDTKELPVLTDTTVWIKDDTRHVEPTDEEEGMDTYLSEYGDVEIVLPKTAKPEIPTLTISPTTLNVPIGETAVITATVTNGVDCMYNETTSDPDIVAITRSSAVVNGVYTVTVRGVSAGTATITLKLTKLGAEDVTATCEVTVTDGDEGKFEITVNPSEKTIAVDEDFTVTVLVTGTTPELENVDGSMQATYDDTLVSVDDGTDTDDGMVYTITGVAAGTTTVDFEWTPDESTGIELERPITVSCEVTVTDPAADTSEWQAAFNGFTGDWGGWAGSASEKGVLTHTCTVKDVMDANGMTSIDELGGILAQVWNAAVGDRVAYAIRIEAADGTIKDKRSGIYTVAEGNDGGADGTFKQYQTAAAGGDFVFAPTDVLRLAVAAGTTIPTIPDIPSHTHTLTAHAAVDATCTAAGNSAYWTCSSCNKIFSDGNGTVEISAIPTIPALGHNYVDGVCTRCGANETVHTHIFGTEWKYSDTRHWHECVCGERADEALHTPDGGTVTKKPTAYETGVRTYYCTVCGGFIFSETIPATGTDPSPVIPYFPPSSTTVSKEPYLQNDSGKKGWEAISDDILSTPDGETVNIKMNGMTELPQNIVSNIAGRDIDLMLDMGDYSWTVNGMSVTNAKSVDMSVRKIDKIPESTVREFFGDLKTVQLELHHNGDFGFIAELTIDIGNRYSGMFANSYCYRSKNFEFGDSSEIVNGKARLRFTHASRWLIAIDSSPVLEDVSTGAAAHSAGTPIDMSNSTSSVTLPEFDEKKKLRLSGSKRRYRILKKRKLDDMVFVL